MTAGGLSGPFPAWTWAASQSGQCTVAPPGGVWCDSYCASATGIETVLTKHKLAKLAVEAFLELCLCRPVSSCTLLNVFIRCLPRRTTKMRPYIWKNFSNEITHFSKSAEHICWWRCLQKTDETISLTSGSNNSFNTSSEPTSKKTWSKDSYIKN